MERRVLPMDRRLWQSSSRMVLLVYGATRYWPKERACGLAEVVRRAAIAVPWSISEAFEKRYAKDKLLCFESAYIYASEVGSRLDAALVSGYLEEAEYFELSLELVLVMRMLSLAINNVY